MLNVCSQLSYSPSLIVDFIGKGNIWINNTYDKSTVQLARDIIWKAIHYTDPGQLYIWGYDADLSGLFAPFSFLSAGENKILDLSLDYTSFVTQLSYIEEQIVTVQNVIQGRTQSLIDFRKEIGRPVEGYRLVVLSLDLGLVDQEILAKLSLLMRSGPAAGISFLIISTTYLSRETASGKEIEIKVESIAPNITVLEAHRQRISCGKDKYADYNAITPMEIIHNCRQFTTIMRNTALPVIDFDEIHSGKEMWSENSTDGITFTIGKTGTESMEITIGDEVNQRHNAIITGAVGQGKSNLISVMIHSMCLRYSPRELVMYLLDFKEGVTFKPFSNIDQDSYLPHAKALGLESDVEFGLAVLDSLYKVYQQRMRLLKDYNVKSIRDFRHKNPDVVMPRIIVIIDEFQMMFGDDVHTGQSIADRLEKSIRLFRAAGIHFILASQTLIGNMALANKKDSLFSQVPIRIALKNSISESQQILNMNNSAAAFLRPREAIVNLDYGEISQNRKAVIAFADEKKLILIRQQMWEKARRYTVPPYVFESERRITISSCLDTIYSLRSATTPSAILGNQISIDGEKVIIPFSKDPGRNIAILGTSDSECDQATGMIQSIATSLALQHPAGDARFLFCDFRLGNESYDTHYPQFASLMEESGFFIENIPSNSFERTLKTLLENGETNDTIYFFGSALDRWDYEKDPFAQGSVLQNFAEKAPSLNMHFIGWWTKAANFSKQTDPYGNSGSFNSKVFLRLDERSVQSLTSPFIRWNARSNRALISDEIEFSNEIVFIPYAPIEAKDINAVRIKNWD